MRSVSSQPAGTATNNTAYTRGYRAGYARGLAEALTSAPRTKILSDFPDDDLAREYEARGLARPTPESSNPAKLQVEREIFFRKLESAGLRGASKVGREQLTSTSEKSTEAKETR